MMWTFLRKHGNDLVKNMLLWRLREPDKEVGPEKYGKRWWTKIVDDLHIKSNHAMDDIMVQW